MSYARPADGDVYIIATRNVHGEEGFECIWCDLFSGVGGGVVSWFTTTEDDMIDHLAAHREKGDQVPQHAIDRLMVEAMEKMGK